VALACARGRDGKDVLERLYENQQALQAAIMELTLLVESKVHRKSAEMSVEHYGPWVKTPAISNKVWRD
jgi:hypothetical protein